MSNGCIFLCLQVKLQKHQAFEAEISAHTNTIITIRTTGEQMITEEHYESVTIRVCNVNCLILEESYVLAAI